MLVVMAKPDALTGPGSMVSRHRARGLLLALARHCGHPATLPPNLAELADHAALQITERAATEVPFVGTLRHRRRCAQDLLSLAEYLPHQSLATTKVLLISLRGLGFRVTHHADYVITIADVDAIYAQSTGEDYQQIRGQLIDYLVGNFVRVKWIAGDQHPAALQHWKTYVRHLLVDRPRTSGYLLRNLVHVCEGPDATHLTRLLHLDATKTDEERPKWPSSAGTPLPSPTAPKYVRSTDSCSSTTAAC